MGPTFIEILHPDDVIVLDSVEITKCFNDDASVTTEFTCFQHQQEADRCESFPHWLLSKHQKWKLTAHEDFTSSTRRSRSPDWGLSSVSSSRTSWRTAFPSSSPSPWTPLRTPPCWLTQTWWVNNDEVSHTDRDKKVSSSQTNWVFPSY